MRVAPLVFVALFTACAAAPRRPAPVAEPTHPRARSIDRARKALAARIATGIPGMSVAVSIRGKTIWSQGFGDADVEAHRRVDTTTEFRIGSVAKSITSIALGQLVEQKKLDLDVEVQTYAPTFPKKSFPITTRQLAGHLAGIRHYKEDRELYMTQHYATLTDALAIFKDDPLLFTPGTKYAYSSYGWNLIGVVIEGASGETYLGYMKNHVFDPLEMPHTEPDLAGTNNPNRTQFYERDKTGKVAIAPAIDNSYKWPSGGLLSTPEDLVRLGAALLSPGMLRASTLSLLFTSMQTSDGNETAYGLGWSTRADAHQHRRWWHTGGSVGGTTYFGIYPDQGVVLAIVSNLSDVDDLGTDAVAAAFLDEATPN